MTDEEMAEEYIKKNNLEWELECNRTSPIGEVKQAFLAGLKAGRPKWHKVANGDLPTEEKEYIVKLTDGTVDIMPVALDGDLEPYVPSISIDFYRDVEKWCEIPKFEEE